MLYLMNFNQLNSLLDNLTRVEYNGRPSANFRAFTSGDRTNACWIGQSVRAFNPQSCAKRSALRDAEIATENSVSRDL